MSFNVDNVEGDNVKLGFHVNYKNSLYNALKDLHPKIPYQVFISSSDNIYQTISDEEAEKIAKLVETKKLKFFIHSPYRFNPAKNFYISNAIEHLKISTKMKASGYIIHVGKYTDLGEEQGLKNMIDYVKKIIPNASRQSPLLIETPAGEGTELLTVIEDFLSFFANFDDSERRLMGICIDTCHVFASGYDPLEYIKRWNECYFIPIYLIHFNDSKKERGSEVDLHAFPGRGYIGEKKMTEIYNYCLKFNIPMIIE